MTKPFYLEVLDLDRALTALASIDARKSRIAELRFFGGLSLEETSEAVNFSRARESLTFGTGRPM